MAFRADTDVSDITKMARDMKRPKNSLKIDKNEASLKQYDSFTVKQILTKQNNKVQFLATFPSFYGCWRWMILMKTGKSSKLEKY